MTLSVLALAGATWAVAGTPPRDGGGGPGASKVYIVQLKAPAAVAYHAAGARVSAGAAKLSGGTMTAPGFDKHAAGVQSYVSRLTHQHDTVLARLGPDPHKIYSYRYALNGFAARMTPAEALQLERMPEVLHVWEDEVRPLATSFSAEFLDLFNAEVGLRSATLGLTGEDVVIGVIDSGITPEHPSLAETREADRPRACRSRWAETSLLGMWLCRRYDQLEDEVVYQPPVNWNGICQAGPQFAADACNNKLIGARYFFEGADATGNFDDGEIFSARDVDGHGTHTATTAAGNRVRASIFGTLLGRVEGIAPRARVAAYKACWLRPGDLRASCNTSDLANAIDAAVADGVHIINYSVGSSVMTATAPDDIALMAAAKAGVLTVVAAGNEGPGFNTIGSPGGAPWVITTGASSRTGEHSLEALEVTAPASVAGRYAVREASFTTPLIEEDAIEGRLVLVDDGDGTGDGSAGTTFDACEPLVNGDAVSGNIAYIQRGSCDFQVKLDHAADAGAIAAVVFNIAGAPIAMTGTSDPGIPALMIGQADGNLLLAEIDAGQTIEVVLDKGLLVTEEDTGNVMGAFSSRGPGPIQDILKPDVTAPGINILAGFTPDAANSLAGESFAFLTGTSMAAPHVAGVAALLREAHPEWSPAAIKSALMTTAYQDVRQQDGESPAHPFDFGSGHIDPNRANDPGLVYDVTKDEYDAFACGTASPAVDEERCDALAIDGFSEEAVDLNQPSIAVSRLTATQTVSRRVTNVSDTTGNYTAQIEAPPGISVLVAPSTLSLEPGASAEFEVTFGFESGPLDTWRFGSLTWVGDAHEVRSVLAIRPRTIDAPAEIRASGSTNSVSFPVGFGYTGTYSAGVHGLAPAAVSEETFIEQDPNQDFTFRASDGVNVHFIENLAPGQAYLRFALFDEFTDGEDDLDMYIRYCPTLTSCRKIAESGEPTSREQVNILQPPPGRYEVFVHGFATDDAGGPGANYRLFTWYFGLDDDRENMTVDAPGTLDAPGFVEAGTTSNITLDWAALPPGKYLGAISHNTPDLNAITIVEVCVDNVTCPN